MVFLLVDVFRVFGSSFVFLAGVFLGCLFDFFSWAQLGMFFAYSVLPSGF